LGAGCRQFESGRPDHFKNRVYTKVWGMRYFLGYG